MTYERTTNKAFGMNNSSGFCKFCLISPRGCYWSCSNVGTLMKTLGKTGI